MVNISNVFRAKLIPQTFLLFLEHLKTKGFDLINIGTLRIDRGYPSAVADLSTCIYNSDSLISILNISL